MSCKIYGSFENKKQFYGIRIYVSCKPAGVFQEYLSFKKNGKELSKKVQKLLMKQALAREYELREQHNAHFKGSIFIKNKRGPHSIDAREIQTPSKISGLNFNMSSVRPEHEQYIDWEAVGAGKNYDIQFHSYPPFVNVYRKIMNDKSMRFSFRNKRDYFKQYKIAVEHYAKTYKCSDEDVTKMLELQPKWQEVRDFILAEAIRLYSIKPLGLKKIA